MQQRSENNKKIVLSVLEIKNHNCICNGITIAGK